MAKPTKPLPPDVLADALQDRIHATSGRVRAAKSVKVPTSELERIIGPYINEATSISMCSPDLRKEERRELLHAVVQGACLAAVKAFAQNLDSQIEWSYPDYPVFQRVLAEWTGEEAPTKEGA